MVNHDDDDDDKYYANCFEDGIVLENSLLKNEYHSESNHDDIDNN